jgi:hypothetical protein
LKTDKPYTWADDLCSRRVDDSRTVGRISVAGGASLVNSLNVFNWCDAFSEEDGDIVWRACGYSGITRGVIVEVSPDAEFVTFDIQDVHLGRVALQEQMIIPLSERHARRQRVLDLDARFRRPLFEKTDHVAQFVLNVDWVDLTWPSVIAVDWVDEAETEDFYYARIEQVDGELAWSSPLWFRREV